MPHLLLSSFLIKFVTNILDLGLVGLVDGDPNYVTIVPTAVDSVDEGTNTSVWSFQVSMCVSQVSQDRE